MATVISTRKFVYTSVGENSNKFWNVTLFDNGDVETRWGRVGEPGQSKMFPSVGMGFVDKKVREKLGKGYKEFDEVGTSSHIPVMGAHLKEVAVKQIKHDPLFSSLIDKLVKENKHNILGNTSLSFSESTGLFSTPLGVVTPSNVVRARNLLVSIGGYISGTKQMNSWEINSLIEEYMMLVPQDIGRKRLTIEEVFPSIHSVRRQSDVLDSLDASLQMSPVDTPKDFESVFDVELSAASSKDVRKIEKMFRDTMRAGHESSRLRVARVFSVDIRQARERFVGPDNIRVLWHGTRVGNILSILRSGLIIPPESASHCTGRMYGNGVYGSDISTKSLNYSYGYWDGGRRDSNCYMFVAEFAMGREYIPGSGPYPKRGYDSTFARGGSTGVINNEMIVYQTNRVNLTHLVEFEG